MFPITKEQINRLSENDLEMLCFLDSQGLLLGVDESFAEYKARLLKIYEDIVYINSEFTAKSSLRIDSKTYVQEENLLSVEKYNGPNQLLSERYGFKIDWVSTFFCKNAGLFAGACAITFESGFTSILVNKHFKGKDRWLIYPLQEILTHELCHVARSPIKEDKLEEFFAYSLSGSKIRRYFGNCFRSQLDSILLLLPVFILFCVQILKACFFYHLNITFFWLLIFVYPAFLLIRNYASVKAYLKAENTLKETGISTSNIPAILFRCSYDEITQIAKCYKNPVKVEEWLKQKTNVELRWQVLMKRFTTCLTYE